MCEAALASVPPRADLNPGYGWGWYAGFKDDSCGKKRKMHGTNLNCQ
jgi:hypothetical protein